MRSEKRQMLEVEEDILDRELIRRARRDGREARVNEEREKREDEKGSHCFLKSSG